MSDGIVSLLCFALTAAILWWFTRRLEDEYVAKQWGNPIPVLVRLGCVFVCIHLLFALIDLPGYYGYLLLVAGALFAFGLDMTGVLAGVFLVVSFVFYEWVFWFPRSRAAVLDASVSSLPQPHGEVELRSAGVALSDLKPVGKVLIDGHEYTARSDYEMIAKGEAVIVDSVGDFELVVRLQAILSS